MTAAEERPKWISAPGCESPALARSFEVEGTGDADAFLRIAAPGFYEAWLDGQRVGDAVLDPSPTDYTKRIYWREYPLRLSPGRHELMVLLGHGWYDQRAISAWRNHLDKWRAAPCLWAELVVERADGTRLSIVTDGTWRQVPSPLAWDDLREGEIYDPGFVLPRPGFTDGAAASVVPGPAGCLMEADFPPARVIRSFPASRVWRPKAGGWLFDFGENLSGWARVTFHGGRRGEVATLRYDERVTSDGEPAVHMEPKDLTRRSVAGVWPENSRAIDCHHTSFASDGIIPGAAMQQDRVVLSGGGSNTFEARFTPKGFRYLWVSGVEAKPDAEARQVRTDFARSGSFECSDRDLNDLVGMAERSYDANFTDGVPTDCPHREKNGWTGDAQIACELAQYFRENTAAYVKWCRDIADSQRADGNLPGVAPTGGWGFEEKAGGLGFGPVWGGAVAVVPWMLYAYRATTAGLDASWDAMRRYADYEESLLDGRGIVRHGLGDWIPASDSVRGEPGFVDADFVGTAYHFAVLRIVSETARLKGLADEAAKYSALAEKARRSFNAVFAKGDGLYGNGNQTEQAVALAFGIAPEADRAAAGERLVEAVHRAGDRFDGGLVGSKHVFRALSGIGRTDLAFAMLKAKGAPGFLHMRDGGGKTLWEDWWSGGSRNHVMFADFACWACQHLAGIRLEEREGSTAAVPLPAGPGFTRAVVAPDCIAALDWARGSVDAGRGPLSSEWRREKGGAILLRVHVPPGTNVRVVLPGASVHDLSTPGIREFRFRV